jgi:hypothetical protein
MMHERMKAVYTRKDPNGVGKPAEVSPVWEKMLQMAAQNKDEETAQTARSQLPKKQ